jgi:hypothetical protein
MHEYNAVGSPAMAAAKKTSGDGFAKGGATVPKRREGGSVGGAPPAPRLDQKQRGGSIQKRAHGGSVHGMKSKGGSPMSSAHSSDSAKGKSEGGHEGESVAECV